VKRIIGAVLGKLFRAVLVLAVVFSVLPLRAGWAAGTKARRLNIVFILADDLGWSDLGCYGNKVHETPNIDKLATQGVRFTQFYTCAVCMPSRVSLLTGKNPNRPTDLWGMKQPCNFTPWSPLEPGEITYAQALKTVGYTTGHIGKWGVRHRKDQGEKDRGFDRCYFTEDWYYLPNYRFPYFEGENHFMDLKLGEDRGYLVEGMTKAAEEFLSENRNRPFMLTLSHFAVHTPVRNQGRPDLAEKYRKKAEMMDASINPDYAAIVQSLDESTGRVLEKIKELGLEDRTVVIFLSDNGGEHNPEYPGEKGITSNAPLREGKATIYEGGVRVPFIVRWPGVVNPGTVSSAIVAVEDMYPTFLDIAGVGVPKAQKIDGISLVPVLTGQKGSLRDTVFLQWEGAMVRRGNYKLIEFPPYFPTKEEVDGARKKAEKKGNKFEPPKPSRLRIELYDLASDIGETQNIAGDKPEVAKELRRALHNWFKEMHGESNYSLDRVREDAKKQGQVYPDP